MDYPAAVAALRRQYDSLPPGAPVRLGKATSNLFRQREASTAPRLDVSAFSGVLEVDVAGRTADVLGMTTYEDLVDATLPHGLMPKVVPQLKTITLGGAVAGLGIESSSFRNGGPHESVLEMDVLTGDGRVLTARPDNEHRELFYGFPNSYGTLGYALRLRIELEPVRPFVALRHVRCSTAAEAASLMAREVAAGDADFIDGTWFGPDEVYVTLGTWADSGTPSDYTGMNIYYRSIQQRETDCLTVHDYLWRWDTDWFWCSRAFEVQRPAVRRLVPKRYLRSDVYWKLVGFEKRHGWKAALDRRRGLPDRGDVVQDVEVPVDRLSDFLEVFAREVPMAPVWLCPLKQRNPDVTWELYPLDPSVLYINLGFWGTVPLEPGQDRWHHDRLVEDLVEQVGGHKSLYSTSHYEPDHFHRLYGGDVYDVLKKTYDAQGRLLRLYDKAVKAK